VSVSLIDKIKEKVGEIACDEELPESEAFGFYFLEEFEDLSKEDARNVIIDGPWDRGCDAIYLDEENNLLKIYQFKYSENQYYVKNALTDLQRGVEAEEKRGDLQNIKVLDLIIVTIAQYRYDAKNEREIIEKWLKEKGYSDIQVNVEIIDISRFRELYDKICGVNITLTWKPKSIIDGIAVIGRLDASKFVDVIDKEELFSLNVRKFLGLRRGSVTWKIMESLSNPELRNNFWVLNNGIVCLCTDFKEIEDNKVKFENFTIVNGAQTIGTIATYLRRNPLAGPIWVVAKVLKVSSTDVDWAARITEASNTQTPTSTRDLRSRDVFHRWLEEWLDNEFGLSYIYKRGQRFPRDREKVEMKEIAQAYITFWSEKPHISFARPGQIFSRNDYYEEVFPHDVLQQLRESGKRDEIRIFLIRRLLPWKIMKKVRRFLRVHTGKGKDYDEKYRSLTYHITWLYKKLLEEEISEDNLENILGKIDEITSEDILMGLFDRLITFIEDSRKDIPKILKIEDFRIELEETIIGSAKFKKIKGKISNIFRD